MDERARLRADSLRADTVEGRALRAIRREATDGLHRIGAADGRSGGRRPEPRPLSLVARTRAPWRRGIVAAARGVRLGRQKKFGRWLRTRYPARPLAVRAAPSRSISIARVAPQRIGRRRKWTQYWGPPAPHRRPNKVGPWLSKAVQNGVTGLTLSLTVRIHLQPELLDATACAPSATAGATPVFSRTLFRRSGCQRRSAATWCAPFAFARYHGLSALNVCGCARHRPPTVCQSRPQDNGTTNGCIAI